MELITILGLGLVLVLITVFLHSQGKPEYMEKRTYIFEDENGEEYNPFGDMSDGAEDDGGWSYSPEDF